MGQPGCNTHGFSPSELDDYDSGIGSCSGSCSSYQTSNESRFGGEKEKELRTPVWKLKDENITFYDSTLNCKGNTNWCIDHCLSKTKPFPFDIKKIDPLYNINKFTNFIRYQPFKEDFLAAKYVTLLGTGTLETINNNVDVVITEIPKRWPHKLFRFFIRSPIGEIKISDNVKVIFSVDKDTKIDYLEWAIEAPQVSAIAVIKHKDNKILIHYLKTKIFKVIDCNKCSEMDCACFKNKEKRLILMNYIK